MDGWGVAGQKFLLAGATRGIGLHLACRLVEYGARVALCGRDPASLAAARAKLAAVEGAGEANVSPCDLTDHAGMKAWVGESVGWLGGLDTLVCMATAQATGSDEGDWQRSFGVDLLAPVRLMGLAERALFESSRGSVLLVASRTALAPAPTFTAYATMKAALVHLTGSKAAAYLRNGVRVNCVAPGSTEYPGGLWERLRSDEPAVYAGTVSAMPFGRLGTPEDVVPAMIFLSSPAARWITGQTLLVDGGQLLAP